MARKDRGIFERPKGSAIWWVRYADNFGRIHREKVGPRGLAKDVYAKRKLEVREGRFFPETLKRKRAILFTDMAVLYLEEYSKVNKLSYKNDKANMERLIIAFGDKALWEVNRQDVERFKGKLVQEVSRTTVNRHLALFKGVYNKAIEWGKTEDNPVRGIKLYKENGRVRFLSDEEENNLTAKIPNQYRQWVEIAILTGMRRSEQFNLRWENVNFQSRIITIPRSKGGEVRHIPMNDRVVEILRDLPSRMKSEWVFPSSTGTTPMSGNNFTKRVFIPAVKKAEIKNFRWHDLRHTFASRLVMKGNDLKTVQELMGHKKIEMTLRYAHLSPKHKMDAVQTLVRAENEVQTSTSTGTEQKKGVKHNA